MELKVPGWHSSGNIVPWLTQRHFISKRLPPWKKARLQRWCILYQKCGNCVDATLDSVWNVSETSKLRSTSKVLMPIKYYSFIIFISSLFKSNFKAVWYWYSDSVYLSKSERKIIYSKFIAIEMKCWILKL